MFTLIAMRKRFPALYLLIALISGVAGMLLGAGLPVGAIVHSLQPAGFSIQQDGFLKPGPARPSVIDTGFARAMIQHHNQALLMANTVRNHPDATIRALAESIHQKQLFENGQITGWLTAWGEPTFAINAMDWVEKTTQPLSADDVLFISRCTATPGQMPGQLSSEELSRLREARPEAQARLFLDFMRRHHEGAIDMALFAFRHATVPFVKRFALTVTKEQGREIAWINQRLAQTGEQQP